MITFKVHPDGKESYEVTATTRDIVRWEKSGKNRSFAKLMEDVQLADMYELAYYASQRAKSFNGSLDTFLDTVDLEFETEDQDPTRGDR